MAEQLIGSVTHFFNKAGVIAIEMSEGELKVGDAIHVVGHLTDFTETVASMQIEHISVLEAKPGDLIGIKVPDRVRPGDRVYKVIE